MTSVATQALVCPVPGIRHDDVVIWYKDGQPIPTDTPSILSPQPMSTNIGKNISFISSIIKKKYEQIYTLKMYFQAPVLPVALESNS
jgi:hypothetical protein